MKKAISVFLAFALITVLFIKVNAVTEPPVFAEFSNISDGEINLSIKINPVKSLTGLIIRVECDTSVFSLINAEAAYCIDEDGNKIDNFSGIWTHGKRNDDTGYSAAFFSTSGVSKSLQTEAFTFTFNIINGYSDNTYINVYISDLTTDDDDYENDIENDTLISSRTYTFTDSDRFKTLPNENGTVNIVSYNFNESRVIIPNSISQNAVKLVSQNAFSDENERIIDFSKSSADLENGSVGENDIIVCNFESDVYSSAVSQNINVIAVKEGTDTDILNSSFITDKKHSESENELLACNGITVTPFASYTPGEKMLFGTGSTFTFSTANNSVDFSLAVKGDYNGDSTSDVIDAFLFERAVFVGEAFWGAKKQATDINGDGFLNTEDYSALVNIALS